MLSGLCVFLVFQLTPKLSFDTTTTETWMRNTARYASAAPWDPRAQALFGVSEKATRAVFGIDQLRLRARSADAAKGAITVHWEFTSGKAQGDLYLYDEPLGTSFGLRVKGLSLDEMVEASPKLFRVTPKMQLAEDGSARFEWGVTMAAFDMMNYWATATRNARSGDWFMTVRYGKLRLLDHYRGVSQKHRIPAFKDMIKTWPLTRLLSEFHPTLLDFDGENQALLDEVALRQPPDGVWLEILQRSAKSRDALQTSYDSILAALQQADPTLEQAAQFSEASLDAMAATGNLGIFSMRGRLPCSDPFERLVLDLLGRGAHLKKALAYVESCSGSRQVYERLKSFTAPPDLQNELRLALERLEVRFSKRDGK